MLLCVKPVYGFLINLPMLVTSRVVSRASAKPASCLYENIGQIPDRSQKRENEHPNWHKKRSNHVNIRTYAMQFLDIKQHKNNIQCYTGRLHLLVRVIKWSLQLRAEVSHFKSLLNFKLFKKKRYAAGANSNFAGADRYFAGADRNFAGAYSINHSLTDIPEDKRHQTNKGGGWKC